MVEKKWALVYLSEVLSTEQNQEEKLYPAITIIRVISIGNSFKSSYITTSA